MAKAHKKKLKPGETPKLKFKYIRKEVTQEEFDAAVADVQAAWRNEQASARDFGWKLLKLRKLMYTHGQFTKWLRANSIDQNHASYCMRTCQGLTKKAQERIKNLPVSVVKKQIDELFKPAEEKLPVQVSGQVAHFILETCGQLGKASGWTFKPGIINEANTFSAIGEGTQSKLTTPLTKAVSNLLDELFVWEDYYEPDNQVTLKVAPAGKKSQYQEQQARAAAAAASGGMIKPPIAPTPPPVRQQK